MGDDSTGTVLTYQLADTVYQSNTMDNLALMGQLFHPLAESHGQAYMEVDEKVSPTAILHIPLAQHRQWALPFHDSLAVLGHPIWELGHPRFFWNTHDIYQRDFTDSQNQASRYAHHPSTLVEPYHRISMLGH